MDRLPKQAREILKALSYFHYLNNRQLVELGVSSSVDSIKNHGLLHIGPRRDKKTGKIINEKGKKLSSYYCNNLRYGNEDPTQKGGKLPYLHYLTPKGRDYLYEICADEIDDDEAIWIPTAKDRLTNDYFHRTQYVSTHMHIRRWAQKNNATIDFFTHEYQGVPNSGRGKPKSINEIARDNRQQPIKPDGILGLEHTGKKRLFLVEFHNHTPTKKVVTQLYKNFSVTKFVKQKFVHYSTQNDPFVLSVHANRAILKATKREVLAAPAFRQVLKGLLFAHLDDLKEDFANAWTYADGSPARMFQ